MSLQNFQYDIIMREYSRRQSQVQNELEEHRKEAFQKVPRLLEIDQTVASLSAEKIRTMLQGHHGSLEDLKEEIAVLADERKALLRKNGFSPDYLEPHYYCPLCQDTGYVDGHKCSCFKKAEIELLYTQSNLTEILQKENFEHFSFDWYSDTIKSETTGLSAQDTARRAYNAARNFVRDFDLRFQNLFLYGNTGVGKTFLSHCIAHDLLETSHCVLYFCDLLIIDDLGTELTNSFVSSQLFLCINERIARRKSTIISTNLRLEDFSSTYSERTFSRIASNYQMLKLIGKDIRIQKIFNNSK